jgi:ATPase subunit of ABC transporter with duplicated ATPase domains
MALISIIDGVFSYGGPLLLEGIKLDIQPGERICLLGRNGLLISRTHMTSLEGHMDRDISI